MTTQLSEVSLSEIDKRILALQETILKANGAIENAEEAASSARTTLSVSGHELAYWSALGKKLVLEQLDECKKMILDAISLGTPTDQPLGITSNVRHAAFYIHLQEIHNKYAAEEAKALAKEMKALVPAWFNINIINQIWDYLVKKEGGD
jgi:hypothetical protein